MVKSLDKRGEVDMTYRKGVRWPSLLQPSCAVTRINSGTPKRFCFKDSKCAGELSTSWMTDPEQRMLRTSCSMSSKTNMGNSASTDKSAPIEHFDPGRASGERLVNLKSVKGYRETYLAQSESQPGG